MWLRVTTLTVCCLVATSESSKRLVLASDRKTSCLWKNSASPHMQQSLTVVRVVPGQSDRKSLPSLLPGLMFPVPSYSTYGLRFRPMAFLRSFPIIPIPRPTAVFGPHRCGSESMFAGFEPAACHRIGLSRQPVPAALTSDLSHTPDSGRTHLANQAAPHSQRGIAAHPPVYSQGTSVRPLSQ